MAARNDTMADDSPAEWGRFGERAALGVREIADVLGVNVATVLAWDALQAFPEPVALRGARLWAAAELAAWWEAGAPPGPVWARLA